MVAVSSARGARQVSVDERRVLQHLAAALSPTLALPQVLEELAGAAHELTAAQRVTVLTLEDGRLVTTVVRPDRPGRQSEGQPGTGIPVGPDLAALLERGGAVGVVDAAADPGMPEGWAERSSAASVALVPLRVQGDPRGLLVIDYAERQEPTHDELAALEAIAACAGVAIRAASGPEGAARRGGGREVGDEREHEVRQLAVLHRLAAAVLDDAEADALFRQLRELLAPEGLEVTGIAFHQRDLARHLGGPTGQGDDGAWDDPGDGVVEVPMRLGDRSVGSLRIRPDADQPPSWRQFAEAVASGVAQIASNVVLRTAVEQARREQALAQERDRIAVELHQTLDTALEAIASRLRRAGEELPPGTDARPLAATGRLADGARWELEQAVRALAFVPGGRRGLPGALRGLARQMQEDSGITVIVEVAGRPARLPGAIERVVYRVASEALVSGWRYGRCSVLRVELGFSADELTLVITDDGLPVARRIADLAAGWAAKRIRQTAEDVGGSVRMQETTPHGMTLTATFPRGSRSAS